MTILYTLIAIALLIIVHELGHFLTAKFFNMRVDEFGIGFPPRLFFKKIGETIYSLNLFPLGGFVRIHGESALEHASSDPRSFAAASFWKRFLVVCSGVCMNFLAGYLIISYIFFTGTPRGVIIQKVLPDSPAIASGIKAGDVLFSFASSQDFINFVNQNRGKPILLSLQRKSGLVKITATPRPGTKPGEGSLGVFVSDIGTPPHSIGSSLVEGLYFSLKMLSGIFLGLVKIFLSLLTEGRLVEGFVGPIGVFGIAAQSAQMGFIFLLELIGVISLNLAALNVLPFPALDGGKLFFLILEKIKGSRLSLKFESFANAISFTILIALIILVTLRDIANLL